MYQSQKLTFKDWTGFVKKTLPTENSNDSSALLSLADESHIVQLHHLYLSVYRYKINST